MNKMQMQKCMQNGKIVTRNAIFWKCASKDVCVEHDNFVHVLNAGQMKCKI